MGKIDKYRERETNTHISCLKKIVEEFCHEGHNIYIPIFQRDFVGGKDQFNLLFDDIQNLKSNEYHFCGFIFLFCDDKENYMLLDGQQRLTTLFLLSRLVALRDDRLKEGEKEFFYDGEPKIKFNKNIKSSIDMFLQNNLKGIAPQINKLSKTSGEKLLWDSFNAHPNLKYTKVIECVSFADFLIPDNYDVNDIFDRINNSGIELTSFDIFKNIKLLNVDEENNKYKMWRECFDNDGNEEDGWFSINKQKLTKKLNKAVWNNYLMGEFALKRESCTISGGREIKDIYDDDFKFLITIIDTNKKVRSFLDKNWILKLLICDITSFIPLFFFLIEKNRTDDIKTCIAGLMFKKIFKTRSAGESDTFNRMIHNGSNNSNIKETLLNVVQDAGLKSLDNIDDIELSFKNATSKIILLCYYFLNDYFIDMLEPQMEFNSVEHVMPTKNNDEVSEELLDSIANKILIDKRSNAKFSNSGIRAKNKYYDESSSKEYINKMLIDKNALINENYAIKDLEKIMRNNLKQIYRKYFS